jgi:hypothetical protein
MTRPAPAPALLALPLVLAGCFVEPAEEVGVTLAPLAKDNCLDFQCGGNSPDLNGIPFHELGLQGQINAAGLQLLHLRRLGKTYQVHVDGDRLLGLRPGEVLQGTRLVGAELVLTNGANQYEVEITDVQRWLTFQVAPKHAIETYYLTYANDAGERVNLCPNEPSEEVWGLVSSHALVFRGDRYNPETITVSSDIDAAGWFNVACAGGAPAKMHLWRHTGAGAPPGLPTTDDQRQALLKMFAADYCGTGRPFTVMGQALTWDKTGWPDMTFAPYGSFEAAWSADGAICLGTPRLSVPGPHHERGILQEILAECPEIPRCRSAVGGLRSANPL